MQPSKCAIAALTATLLAGCGSAGTPQPLFTVHGRVVDEQGHGLPGAVVSDGQVGVLTDEDGRYAIGLFHPTLHVAKAGFERTSAVAEAGSASDFHLSQDATPPRVGLDSRFVGSRMKGLSSYLKQAGFAVQGYPDSPLSATDALILPAPGPLGSGEIASLRAWLRHGGRLILLGEWGGFADQDLPTLNALGVEAGISFSGSTVKSANGPGADTSLLSVPALSPASLGTLAGARPFQMFASTSLGVQAPARAILSSSADTYAVLSRLGPQVVGAVGPAAEGKLFALGDAAIWLDDDTDNTGSPDWQRGGNKQLATALLRW